MKRLIVFLALFLSACSALQPAAPEIRWLEAGSYSAWDCAGIAGTAEAPIIYRARPGEKVVFNGHVWLSFCPYVWLQGVEIVGNGTDDGYHPGNGTRLINSVVHGFGQGASSGSTVPSYEIYGSIFYGNGSPLNHFGHGLYSQHWLDTGWAVFRHNVVFDNYGWGFHLYGSQTLRNVRLEENAAFGNGDPRGYPRSDMLAGTEAGIDDIEIIGNVLVHSVASDYPTLRVGYKGTNKNVTLVGNYVAGSYPIYIAPTDGLYYASNAVYYATRPPDRTWVWPNEYDERFALVVVVNSSNKASVTVTLPFSGDVWMCNVRSLDNCQDLDVYDGQAQILVGGLPFAVFRAELKFRPEELHIYLPLVMR